MNNGSTNPPIPPVSPLEELEARFGPSGSEISANPGGVAVWLAVKKNGSQTRVIAACGQGELYAKLERADQKRRCASAPQVQGIVWLAAGHARARRAPVAAAAWAGLPEQSRVLSGLSLSVRAPLGVATGTARKASKRYATIVAGSFSTAQRRAGGGWLQSEPAQTRDSGRHVHRGRRVWRCAS
jgi:hypothetical protein